MGVGHRLRRSLGVALAAGLWLAVVPSAQASGDTLDQSQTVATGANSLRTPMAQTFTAGATGRVDRVSLMIATTSGSVTAVVQLQSVSGGKPSGLVLGSSSFTGYINCCHAWHDFVFASPVAVAKGTPYAIVLQSSPAITWYDSYSYDNYPAGQLWLMSAGQWIYQSSFGKDFCFETWVVSGSANTPPAVAEANSVVTAPEGSTATNSGTYSDPDGDSVSLSVSAGSLAKTGSSSGTWTWTAPGADEAPTQNVTVAASDGHGGTASVSFSFTVLPVPPTVTITGAPASGPEGTAITLTGKASSPSAADNAAGFTLNWTVTKNGNPYETGTGTSINVTPDDEGDFAVTLQAIDDGGNSATAAVTFSGANVPPAAAITSVSHATLVLVPLQTVTFSGGFTDPGVLDTHVASWDYGDGSAADTYAYAAGGSGDSTGWYAYAAPGTYTVTYNVVDDDGGTGTATVDVTVETPAQALGIIDSYVQTMQSLNSGEKSGLSAKLRAASASLTRGDTNTTCNQLDAFLNALAAYTTSGQLSATDSATLSSSTWAVHRALGCTKVQVGWLVLSL
ncbi:MAG TPA: PKD domain-containing protein [Candidatus Dormibacteraeota bacterium]|nr:PKD domain-containing protein [Candidatus Dormibacteraeota bacterium]